VTFALGGDLEVHRLGFGAMRLPARRDDAARLLRRAYELGCNLIDTADMYGPYTSEELIAEALRAGGSYPDDLVIATKGGLVRPPGTVGEWPRDGRPEHLRRACEDSLRRLRLDRIDLYQLHRPDERVPFAESVGALRELRDEGKIRHVGLSNVSTEQLAEARGIVEIAGVQNEFNLADRRSEPVLAACEQAGIAFVPWAPLTTGDRSDAVAATAARHGATASQVALAWLLQRSEAMLPIPGTGSVEHLEENVAARDLRLDPDEVAALG
jgi:pyridoxine 4-dehydrogenase